MKHLVSAFKPSPVTKTLAREAPQRRPANRWRHFSLWALLALAAAGCTTPNVEPFADATATLTAAVKQAGDMTLEQLAGQTMVVDQEISLPGDTNHPAIQLRVAWARRERSMEAIEAYSASLAAIGAAAASRRENATQVVGAVKDLASNFGFNLGTSASGELLVTLGSAIIEVKAYYDMSRSVEAAQPVVEAVAAALDSDFKSLATQYESVMRLQIRSLKNQSERPRNYYTALLGQRDQLRGGGVDVVNDTGKRERMSALDKLVSGVAPEVADYDRKIAAQDLALKDGLRFFGQAVEAIGAWRTAHDDLHRALKEGRTPNLTVLVSRALELRELVYKLRKNKP